MKRCKIENRLPEIKLLASKISVKIGYFDSRRNDFS